METALLLLVLLLPDIFLLTCTYINLLYCCASAFLPLFTGLIPVGAAPPPPAAALLSQLSDAATRPGIEAALRLLVVLLRDRTTAGQDARTRCRCVK
jgi:hypothetical protein